MSDKAAEVAKPWTLSACETGRHWVFVPGMARGINASSAERAALIVNCVNAHAGLLDELAAAKVREAGLVEALSNYMDAVSLMNSAMNDGISVHGAVAGLVAAEDEARAAIAANQEAKK